MLLNPPRLSVNELTTYRWSLEEDVFHYAAAGYNAIGVWRRKLEDFGEERGVELIRESGLQVTHLSWAGGFTGAEIATFDECVADAKHAIRLAADLNAGCLVVHPGGRNNHTFRHAGRLLRTALDELVIAAELQGVTLALEPMHPACAADWTFLTDVESALAVVEHYNSPALKLVLDTYHFGHDRSLLANLPEVVPHLALVQLADRELAHGIDHDRCVLGSGRVPLGEVVDGLLDAGYDGDFDIELHGADIETRDYHSLLAETQGVLDSLLRPAATA
ncbi:MAG: sugar phosphate isomerase/epimerase family protein [Planctomycetota bacterium]